MSRRPFVDLVLVVGVLVMTTASVLNHQNLEGMRDSWTWQIAADVQTHLPGSAQSITATWETAEGEVVVVETVRGRSYTGREVRYETMEQFHARHRARTQDLVGVCPPGPISSE